MELVDLTVPLDRNTPTHPDDPDVEIEEVTTVMEDGYAVKRLSFPSHVGTHIDVPAHMVSDGKTVDVYPVENFVGEAVVVDVRGEDVVDADVVKDGLGNVDMVFFHTGHAEGAHDGDSDGYHDDGPVLAERTAEVCVDAGVKVVGLDAPSPDEPPYPVHDILLGSDTVILENLTNLGAVGNEPFTCYALPLNIIGGDGAPCRVVGVVD